MNTSSFPEKSRSWAAYVGIGLLIFGIWLTAFVLQELYALYTAPTENAFIQQISSIIQNAPLLTLGDQESLALTEKGAFIVALLLMFLFSSLVAGIAMSAISGGARVISPYLEYSISKIKLDIKNIRGDLSNHKT